MKQLVLLAATLAACTTSPPPAAPTTGTHTPLSAAAAKREETKVEELARLVPDASRQLDGKAIGILYAGGKQAWGTAMQSRTISTGDDNKSYEFSSDGSGPYLLYFHADGGPSSSVDVCIPPAATTKLDGAYIAPGDPNKFGLVQRAYLVELDVNNGKGACGGQFVATGVKIIDHTAELPIDPEGVLVDLRTRFDAEVTKHKRELHEVLGGPLGIKGETLVKRIEMFPTWLTYEQQLEVLFVFQATREGWKDGWGMTEHRDPFLFAHPAPPPPRRVSRDVAMAVRYTVDKHGSLLEELVYLPSAYSLANNRDEGGE